MKIEFQKYQYIEGDWGEGAWLTTCIVDGEEYDDRIIRGSENLVLNKLFKEKGLDIEVTFE